ncbi:MAG TPA: hypothetical protein VN523_03960 [Hyphomicrobiaceae bacterium]|nr:hypothetical protein [Hyphomicrobiaceae bacterium]
MRGYWRAIALIGLMTIGWATAVQAEPRIQWRVENGFRFFLDPVDTEVHRATFDHLSDAERRQPVLAAERLLAARHPDGWSATMFDKTCWDAKQNKYGCRERPDYLAPKSHTILASMEGLEDAQVVDCTWLTSPRRGGRGEAVTLPCDTPVELEVPYPVGTWIVVEIGGRRVAETLARVEDLFIVGMGDSFASGEGNPDVPVRLSPDRTADYDSSLVGYPVRVGDWKAIGDQKFIEENARWQEQACHRSLYSHQLRVALQLAVEDSHRAVTFVGVACSGAEIVYGLFLRYKGHEWVPNPPALSQVSAVAEAQCGEREARDFDLPEAYHMRGKMPEMKGGLVLKKCDQNRARKIDLLLVSIGGNDMGFARLVANAVLADSSTLRSLGGWFGHVHGFAEASRLLEDLDDRLKAINRAVHSILHVPWPESDRIIMTGYPPMALLEDGKTTCPDGQAGMNVLPDLVFSAAKAREGGVAAERLNDILRGGAAQHGWTFIDAHRGAFRGRGICATYTEQQWTMADEQRLPRKFDGVWFPYEPSEWRPYASRRRWFRTPNDAFMTGNFHVSQSLLQNVLKTQAFSWVQLLLASIYSGAFHPTAEGQAAIADAVVEQARGVLTKYDSRRRSAPGLEGGLIQ